MILVIQDVQTVVIVGAKEIALADVLKFVLAQTMVIQTGGMNSPELVALAEAHVIALAFLVVLVHVVAVVV